MKSLIMNTIQILSVVFALYTTSWIPWVLIGFWVFASTFGSLLLMYGNKEALKQVINLNWKQLVLSHFTDLISAFLLAINGYYGCALVFVGAAVVIQSAKMGSFDAKI